MPKPRGFSSGFSRGFGVGRYFYGLMQYAWVANAWALPASVVGAIDLRPISAQSAIGGTPVGFAFVASMQPVHVPIAQALHFADESATTGMRDAWEAETGYRPQGTNVVDLLWDQLTVGSDPDGIAGPKPLMPTLQGQLEMWMGGHSLTRSEPFDIHTHPHRDRVLDMVKRDLLVLRQESIEGKAIRPVVERGRVVAHEVDFDYHRMAMQAAMEKYGCDFETLRPAQWPRSETPRPHLTVITETFNKANADTLGPNMTWTETSGDTDVVNNRARFITVAGALGVEARADTNLSTNDNYAKANCYRAGSTNSSRGVGCRWSSSARDFYLYGYDEASVSDGQLRKKVAGAPTILIQVGESMTSGDMIGVSANGSTIKGFRNGVEKASTTDTGITTGVRSGIVGDGQDTDEVDNFEAGDGTMPGLSKAFRQTLLGVGM